MSLYDDQETPSRAAIGGHPLHPMVVPFPIAFLVGTLVVDIVFSATSDPFWARAARRMAGRRLAYRHRIGAMARTQK
jgi:uncharacterized membrane protein